MTTRRVLVTGSRAWTDVAAVFRALDAELRLTSRELLLVVQGGARGVDAMARAWSVAARPLADYEEHPVTHEMWRTQGNGAGFMRNQAMVDLGAYLCLAFIMPCLSNTCRRAYPHDSHGTADCVRRAREAGIPVREHRP